MTRPPSPDAVPEHERLRAADTLRKYRQCKGWTQPRKTRAEVLRERVLRAVGDFEEKRRK